MTDLLIQTAHLRLSPRTLAEMEALRARETDPKMRKACGEMLNLMRAEPGNEEYTCDRKIHLPVGRVIGGAGFKGTPSADGDVEIGYGIDEQNRCRGYATEAVQAMTAWALAQPGVRRVLAQTEPGNAISQRVLQKCGFVPCGQGDEGPMFGRT